ncbi:hypothetical protein [Streptomyces griseicoloratus]|uniref:hypothetical protein n=1 Tax=Streptomyces griseicoloratus TaxID=2752516 RepID=UPI002812017C|nr:hypothetical protein [Streptomyces griseicoloratus]
MLPFLLLALVGVVTAVALVGHGAQTLARRAPGPAAAGRPGAGLRALAGFAGAAAVVLYAWGALCVAGAVMSAEDGGAGSSPMPPCRTAGNPELSARVVDYSVSYPPLRFRCETSDGDGYASDEVPGWVNPAVAALALAAVGGAVAAGYANGACRASSSRSQVSKSERPDS